MTDSAEFAHALERALGADDGHGGRLFSVDWDRARTILRYDSPHYSRRFENVPHAAAETFAESRGLVAVNDMAGDGHATKWARL